MTNDTAQFNCPWTLANGVGGQQALTITCLGGMHLIVQVPSDLVILPDSTVMVKQLAGSNEIKVIAKAARANNPEAGNVVSWVTIASTRNCRP
jgi:hypothetical protein